MVLVFILEQYLLPLHKIVLFLIVFIVIMVKVLFVILICHRIIPLYPRFVLMIWKKEHVHGLHVVGGALVAVLVVVLVSVASNPLPK
jgi:hypothetical protein